MSTITLILIIYFSGFIVNIALGIFGIKAKQPFCQDIGKILVMFSFTSWIILVLVLVLLVEVWCRIDTRIARILKEEDSRR